jgi:FkbM family methyltransferase
MNLLEVRTVEGIKLAVPATLDSITTYVLLEQESWFEKETAFLSSWLQPGMTAIDIGANIGFYAALIAHRVGPQGHVFAYEPASEPRALLEHNRALNNFPQIQILTVALSDSVRDGRLLFGESSELNLLGSGAGPGEDVRITTLDLEDTERGWPSPDFVKIDVEGEEEPILAGGRQFFDRHSPLVMFETKTGTTINEGARATFLAMGYRLYRQMGSAPILVPTEQTLDAFELNAFAAKPDRSAALAGAGWLVDDIGDWAPDDDARASALSTLRRKSFSKGFKSLFAKDAFVDPDYADALAGYAAWQMLTLPAATRCAALASALGKLRNLCLRAPTAERLSTLARVAADWGARSESVNVARRIAEFIQRGPVQLREPFWPASSEFDNVPPTGPAEFWLFGAAAAHIERANHYSSLYTGASATLMLVCGLPHVPVEMERRRILAAARAGQRPKIPDRLRVATPDHLNANLWRTGKVPGTVA